MTMGIVEVTSLAKPVIHGPNNKFVVQNKPGPLSGIFVCLPGYDNDPGGISPNFPRIGSARIPIKLKRKWLRLAVNKVIHHHDVFFPSSSGPGATSPAVIRTRAMRASSNTMPKKERPPSPGEAGTKLLNNSLPSASKYSISVLALRVSALLARADSHLAGQRL